MYYVSGRLKEEFQETIQVKKSIERNLSQLRPPREDSKLIEELS